jgi:hypothetical protein
LDLDSDDTELQTEIVTTWLLRSAGCSLTIKLTCFDYQSGKYGLHPAADAIIQHSDRWENAYISGPPDFYNNVIATKGRLSRLDKLSIWLTHNYLGSPSPINVFSVAPRLYDITLRHADPSMVALPWKQVKQCKLCLTGQYCLETLSRMTSLVECHLEDIGYATVSFQVVSHLRSLLLTGYTDGVFALFQGLLLPDVSTITFDLEQNTWLPHEFLPFIRRSSCSLKRLTLLAVELTSDELIDCLFELPSLSELEIDSVWYWGPELDDCFGEAVLSQLTIIDGKPACILPNLQVLQLWGPMQFDDHRFADMVQSRWCEPPRHIARLESIRLRYHREWDKEAIGRLGQLQDEGLEFFIQMVPETARSKPKRSFW